MNNLIDYLNSKLEQSRFSKVNLTEVIFYLKEEIISALTEIQRVEQERDSYAKECEILRARVSELELHTLKHPNSYKTQLEKLEAENSRLRSENEMLRVAKPFVSVTGAHPARSSSRWN